MRKSIICFVYLSVIILFTYADNNDEQIRLFWDFVKSNESEVINAKNQDVSLWNELNSYLQKIDKSIYALVSKEDGNVYIIITAGGIKKALLFVMTLFKEQ